MMTSGVFRRTIVEMFASDVLKDQTIVVTGGGTGLGRAMAERFAELGARLILVARQLDRLETTAREFESRFGAQVLPRRHGNLSSHGLYFFVAYATFCSKKSGGQSSARLCSICSRTRMAVFRSSGEIPEKIALRIPGITSAIWSCT